MHISSSSSNSIIIYIIVNLIIITMIVQHVVSLLAYSKPRNCTKIRTLCAHVHVFKAVYNIIKLSVVKDDG